MSERNANNRVLPCTPRGTRSSGCTGRCYIAPSPSSRSNVFVSRSVAASCACIASRILTSGCTDPSALTLSTLASERDVRGGQPSVRPRGGL